MRQTRSKLKTPRVEKTTLRARWQALLKEIRSGVPVEVTEEEIERDVAQAIAAVRQGRHARRP
jgi:antitoxin (DNA-binding transcriptional repressor) of toxin-antitoxin stability system